MTLPILLLIKGEVRRGLFRLTPQSLDLPQKLPHIEDPCSKCSLGTSYSPLVKSRLTSSRELTGGGLVRSQGGWSQVLSLRRRGQKEDFDQRILGSGEFVNQILKEAEERHLRQLKHERSGKTIQKIIDQECRGSGINPLELRGGGKRRDVSGTRARIARRGRDELGLSAAAIARHVGVGTPAITKALERMEKETG